MEKNMLKTGEAAKYLGVSKRYLQEISSLKLIPFYQLGKTHRIYSTDDLDAFLEKNRVGGD